MTGRRAPWMVIARREFRERVRTIWFVIVTILGPIGMVGVIVVPALLAADAAKDATEVRIIDRSGQVGVELIDSLAEVRIHAELVATETPEKDLLAQIASEEIDGFLVVPENLLTSDFPNVIYSGDNATSLMIMTLLERQVVLAVQRVRATHAGVSAAVARKVLEPVLVIPRHTTGRAQATSGAALFITGYVVMFILYMAILLYGVNVLRSVVQEKTSRVVEILVSAIKPHALMLGKIVGVGAVGLFQLGIWALIAAVLVRYQDVILGLFGVSGGGFDLPALGVVDVAVILAYFFAGYTFYSSLYAAVGAMVNSDQEAQQAQTPVMLFLLIPVLCVQIVANDPRSSSAELLTLIPFSSPVLMPMRWLMGGATAGDVVLSLALLLVATVAVVWLAARIYRVGILMHGKRPSLRELIRWVRMS